MQKNTITFKNKRFQKAYDALLKKDPDLLNLDNYVTMDDLYYELIERYEKFYNISNPESTTKTAQAFAKLVTDHIQMQFCEDFYNSFTLNKAISLYTKRSRVDKFECESVAYGKIAEWLVELKKLRKLAKEAGLCEK